MTNKIKGKDITIPLKEKNLLLLLH